MRALWITAAVIFLADQASKWTIVEWMNLKELGRIDVLPPLLTFQMAWNEGINFGLFSSAGDARRWILILVGLVITLLVLRWVRAEKMGRWGMISGGLMVGGALGNVLDRVVWGAVADFLNMSCCGFQNPYSFNIADIAIFAGAIGLILFGPKKPKDDKTP
ncbi:MAG: signal peptidase II [Maritimibacter sp.]